MIPAAKKIGRELLFEAAPELIEAATTRKSPMQALKSIVRQTIKKQVGGGLDLKNLSKKNNGGEPKNGQIISRERAAQKNCSCFFTRAKSDF